LDARLLSNAGTLLPLSDPAFGQDGIHRARFRVLCRDPISVQVLGEEALPAHKKAWKRGWRGQERAARV
jgi:hypothetical protein